MFDPGGVLVACRLRGFTDRLSDSTGFLRSFPLVTSLKKLPKLTGDEYAQLLQWLPGILQRGTVDLNVATHPIIGVSALLPPLKTRACIILSLSPPVRYAAVPEVRLSVDQHIQDVEGREC